MGEVPIYTCKAHVFLIDPETKKSWLPASRTAVPVNFFYDSARRSYRIISVDGTKAIINSTMVPEMSFTKTSAKFGQWADIRAGTVYGLGFNNDNLLNRFLENFNDIRERALELRTQQMPSNEIKESESRDFVEEKQHVNFKIHSKEASVQSATPVKLLSNGGLPQQPAGGAVTSVTAHVEHHRHHDNHIDDVITAMQQMTSPQGQVGGNFATTSRVESAASELKSLRVENQALRQKLNQSNMASEKWKGEAQQQKQKNARLTSALQESITSVDQWHRQLAAFKDENEQLKRKVAELSGLTQPQQPGGSGGGKQEEGEEVQEVRRRLDQAQQERGEAQKENKMLQQKVQLLNCIERQHSDQTSRLKKSQEENCQLKAQVQSLEEKMSRDRNARQRLVGDLVARLTDCSDIAQQMQSSV